MKQLLWILVVIAIAASLGSLGLWIATDRHTLTKFTVVEQIEKEADPDDPFANTGFYDENEPRMVTEKRDEFHFGLLPSGDSPFDGHFLSVATIAAPAWGLCAVVGLIVFVKSRRQGGESADDVGASAETQASSA